jgi:hypothetical protein
LEIIDDGERPELTDYMLEFIQNSVSSKTAQKTDSLGLSYPDIKPYNPKKKPIEYAIVRSVYAYCLKPSKYTVEIAVYRTWPKGNMTVEPIIESSMSMFHKVWEYQMDECYYTSTGRKWDPQLKCFFEELGQTGGISQLFEDIRFLVSNSALNNQVESVTIHETLSSLKSSCMSMC